jgi:hypothetical protein
MPYDEYTIETGEMLSFRMVHHGLWIPVAMSREAVESHFGSPGDGSQALIDIYKTKASEIEERVRPLIRPGTPYSQRNPMQVHRLDVPAHSDRPDRRLRKSS